MRMIYGSKQWGFSPFVCAIDVYSIFLHTETDRFKVASFNSFMYGISAVFL